MQRAPRRAEASEPRYATDIKLAPSNEASGARIVVKLSSAPTYTARLERGGLRLIVDIPEAELRGAPTAITDRVGVVGGVMAQAFKSAGGRTTRILVTLLEQAKYRVQVEGNDRSRGFGSLHAFDDDIASGF